MVNKKKTDPNNSVILNPNFDLEAGYKQKKRGAVIVKSEDVKLNPEYAKYDRIKSYILQRNGNLTIVFGWDDTAQTYTVGIATEWGFIYGIPPHNQADELSFANALFEKWAEAMGYSEERVNLLVNRGII